MVAQVITVVNNSGKIVKTSKTLKNVFVEAKSAYNERKAELKASRLREYDEKEKERKARSQLEGLTLDDDAQSRRSSRRGSDDGRSVARRKPVPKSERNPMERGYSDSFYANDRATAYPRKSSHRPSPLRFDNSGALQDDEPRQGELMRRNTTAMQSRSHARPATPNRSASMGEIDMDLAYGELPPPLPDRRNEDTTELREKMTALQRLLEEANCLQHSATATIDNLQKNPDAMAAVALTLAEISNLAAKLAPGALATMKTSFPAILALLASPQFAIAAGVGVGVTIIAFGSYKIIKKIQARKEEKQVIENAEANAQYIAAEPASPASSVDELKELNRIEKWRRGIADVEADSLGTSVDGEFVTPTASKTLIEEGKLTEADFKTNVSKKTKKSKAAKSESGKSTKTKSKVGSKIGSKEKPKREKEPSGLKMLFTGRSA